MSARGECDGKELEQEQEVRLRRQAAGARCNAAGFYGNGNGKQRVAMPSSCVTDQTQLHALDQARSISRATEKYKTMYIEGMQLWLGLGCAESSPHPAACKKAPCGGLVWKRGGVWEVGRRKRTPLHPKASSAACPAVHGGCLESRGPSFEILNP